MSERHESAFTEQKVLAHFSPAVRNAALLEYQTGESARAAVATIDNSNAVKKMFPNDLEKQNSAYRVLMTVQKIPGYPHIELDDMANLTNADIPVLRAYTREYKPSVALKKVDAAAHELGKLGFPKIQTSNSDDPSKR